MDFLFHLVFCLQRCPIDVLGSRFAPDAESEWKKKIREKAQRKKMNIIPLWYGDDLEFCDGSLIPAVTSLCPFSASDLPLCASHTWLHLTESEVSHHAAACHRAASQTRQCDVGSLITWLNLYLPVPVYIFHIAPQRSNCFSVVYSSLLLFCLVFSFEWSCLPQTTK